jgi:poly(hydroxyalkanoate) depolymerase family esterase
MRDVETNVAMQHYVGGGVAEEKKTMPGLGDTAAMRGKRRRAAGGKPASASDFREITEFGFNPGQLQMLVHKPENLESGAPLVVALHGCGQGGAEYASRAGWTTLADRYRFAVVAPQQTTANNPNRCFNWFNRADVVRGQGEAASIASMVDWMLETEACDAKRVYVTGLSAGGAMTIAMLAAYPDIFDAGAVIAGLPYGAAENIMGAMSAMQRGDGRSSAALGADVPAMANESLPRLMIWHGQADHVVAPSNADAIARQWATAQGLAPLADDMIETDERTQYLWRAVDKSQACIELNLIKGLGHGAPLSTAGPDGVGLAGPFMLECGVSSTSEIAAFWSLVGEAEALRQASRDQTPPKERVARRVVESPSASAPACVGDQVLASLSGRVPSGVHDVIAKALRSAGLTN